MKRILAPLWSLVAIALLGGATCKDTPKSFATTQPATRPTPRGTRRPTPTPPVADRHPVTTTEFGHTRVDDYHWLREKDSPAVLDYLKQENAYTDAMLAPARKLQHKLLDEFNNHAQEDDASVPSLHTDGWLYYERSPEEGDYECYYRKRPDGDAKPQLLLDLNELAKSLQYIELGNFEPSDTGKLLAYTVDPTGYRQYKLSVKDLDTGRLLPDTADRVTTLCWANDDQTLFYTTENDAKRSDKIWRLHLGGTPELLYTEDDTAFDLSVGKTLDRKFIVIAASSYGTADARIVPADQPNITPRQVIPRKKEVEYYVEAHRGGQFFIRTNDSGKNFRIIELPDDAADLTQASELVPPRDEAFLDGIDCFRDVTVLTERVAGLPRLAMLDMATKHEEPVPMPEPVYAVSLETNDRFDTDKLRITYQSLVTPETIFEYDTATKAMTTLRRVDVPGGYDASQYEQRILYAPARDGQHIPISIVWKKGRAAGPHPILLDVYGAYGLPEWVSFDSDRISLLDRGVSYAVVHVRGGGELGKAWHDNGRLMNKRNTFNDVIDAATYLDDQKITTADQTAIYGASAGGLTVGAAINERPDLFKVALLGVPFVDVMNTMLDPSLPLTTQEYLEWGNPTQKTAYEYMLGYSPYDQLAKKKYPATLVFSSYNDSQVMYWEPTKYVAKRRSLAGPNDPPLLLSMTMTGGHDGPSGRSNEFESEGQQYAFLLWQLGIRK